MNVHIDPCFEEKSSSLTLKYLPVHFSENSCIMNGASLYVKTISLKNLVCFFLRPRLKGSEIHPDYLEILRKKEHEKCKGIPTRHISREKYASKRLQIEANIGMGGLKWETTKF